MNEPNIQQQARLVRRNDELLKGILDGSVTAFTVRREENMVFIEEYESVCRESFKLRRQNGK